jgi:hypothetical protein
MNSHNTYQDRLNTAIQLIEVKKYNEAAKEFAKATEIDKNRYEAYYHLGKLYQKLDKIRDAGLHYTSALKLINRKIIELQNSVKFKQVSLEKLNTRKNEIDASLKIIKADIEILDAAIKYYETEHEVDGNDSHPYSIGLNDLPDGAEGFDSPYCDRSFEEDISDATSHVDSKTHVKPDEKKLRNEFDICDGQSSSNNSHIIQVSYNPHMIESDSTCYSESNATSESSNSQLDLLDNNDQFKCEMINELLYFINEMQIFIQFNPNHPDIQMMNKTINVSVKILNCLDGQNEDFNDDELLIAADQSKTLGFIVSKYIFIGVKPEDIFGKDSECSRNSKAYSQLNTPSNSVTSGAASTREQAHTAECSDQNENADEILKQYMITDLEDYIVILQNTTSDFKLTLFTSPAECKEEIISRKLINWLNGNVESFDESELAILTDKNCKLGQIIDYNLQMYLPLPESIVAAINNITSVESESHSRSF